MVSAEDVIRALETPAALIDMEGALVCANPAFQLAGAPVGVLADLVEGASRETLAADGALITWSACELPGGARLVTGRASSNGLDQRERYLASMSHELRTPLNGVLGMAGLLADTRLAADQRAYLATLQDCGEHLLGLVNDILDLARLDSGQLIRRRLSPRRCCSPPPNCSAPAPMPRGWRSPGPRRLTCLSCSPMKAACVRCCSTSPATR